jgi:hypothetical protein
MPRALSVLLLLAAGAPALTTQDADLAAGIELVKEGDFESALPQLDSASRRLERGPRPSRALARAYLYLGISYLELEQEISARARFHAAAVEDPELSLDPKAFSPQVLRFFEAARQEAAADKPSPPPAPSPSPSPQRRRRSPVPAIVLGGGAAAAGIAVATGGGSPTTLATTTTSSTTTTTTSTTTTTTTTTLPAGCRFTLTPDTINIGDRGGNGTCFVDANLPDCPWTAEATQDWIQLTGRTSGVGDGDVRFLVPRNEGGERSGRVRLEEQRTAFCQVVQAAKPLAAVPVSWASTLELPGGAGRLVVAGRAFEQAPGAASGSLAAPDGELRIEGVVEAAAGRAGSWRLELAGPVVPGSLRVLAGDPLLLGPTAVVFRLSGRVGERVALAVRLAR